MRSWPVRRFALAAVCAVLPVGIQPAAAESGAHTLMFDFSGNLVRVPKPAPKPVPQSANTWQVETVSPPLPTRPDGWQPPEPDFTKLEFPPLPKPVGDALEPSDTRWAYVDLLQAQVACLRVAKQHNVDFEPLEPVKKGPCGDPSPVALKRIKGPNGVTFSPPAKLNCEMVAALADWVRADLQRVAKKHLGRRIKTISVMSDYSCRNAYGRRRTRLSEHALANAIDIGGFVAQGDRDIRLLAHWGPTKRDIRAYAEQRERTRLEAEAKEKAKAKAKQDDKKTDRTIASRLGGPQAAPPISDGKAQKLAADLFKTVDPKSRHFLRAVFKTACQRFGTVLGPEANEAHRNHFHFDLAHRRRSNYCR